MQSWLASSFDGFCITGYICITGSSTVAGYDVPLVPGVFKKIPSLAVPVGSVFHCISTILDHTLHYLNLRKYGIIRIVYSRHTTND